MRDRARSRPRAADPARGECVGVGRAPLPVLAAGGDCYVGGRHGAHGALGDQVVYHYLNYACTEQTLDQVVTDWERVRYFERG